MASGKEEIKKDPKSYGGPSGESPQSNCDAQHMESKVFNDPIHGHMEFNPILVKIIDTPQFQRLRNIKQLGGGYFVYPGASHNRFEHSLGVAHLAGKFMRSLQKNQPELLIDERDICCVEIAGLCHDLGHGPFSHMFDGRFIPKARPDLKKWEHEEASVQMFDHIVTKLKEDGFNLELELKELSEKNKDNEDNDDLEFIREMIKGPKGQYNGRNKEKHFLYEIISNKRNGIDVDKFDYFDRDCHHLGIKNSFDHNRFIKFARVCESVENKEKQICIRDKELSNIYEMFHTRSRLHQKAYQHKTNKIIELMITEAFLKADEVLKISEVIDEDGKVNVEEYTKLTDDIFGKILHSSGSELQEAREILEKIVSRKIYRHLGETKFNEKVEITEEKINEWKKELNQLTETENNFEIIVTAFDFGMKENNPVKRLCFYKKADKTKAFKMSEEQVSGFLLPRTFSEKWIHVYWKHSAVAYKDFRNWCSRKDFLVTPPEESSASASTSV